MSKYLCICANAKAVQSSLNSIISINSVSCGSNVNNSNSINSVNSVNSVKAVYSEVLTLSLMEFLEKRDVYNSSFDMIFSSSSIHAKSG